MAPTTTQGKDATTFTATATAPQPADLQPTQRLLGAKYCLAPAATTLTLLRVKVWQPAVMGITSIG